jgi:hypothetical protein
MAGALCVVAFLPRGSVGAQQSTTGTNQSTQSNQSATPVNPPVVSTELQTPTVTVTKRKLDRYKGHVLAFNLAALIVQSDTDPRFIWSFAYSLELRAKVIELLNTGGYRYGDHIQVYCRPGTTIAVKFKGKPSGSRSS